MCVMVSASLISCLPLNVATFQDSSWCRSTFLSSISSTPSGSLSATYFSAGIEPPCVLSLLNGKGLRVEDNGEMSQRNASSRAAFIFMVEQNIHVLVCIYQLNLLVWHYSMLEASHLKQRHQVMAYVFVDILQKTFENKYIFCSICPQCHRSICIKLTLDEFST